MRYIAGPMTARILQLMAAMTLLSMAWLTTGCQQPFQDDGPSDLHRGLVESVRREIDSLPEIAPTRETEQTLSAIEEKLASRIDELNATAGPAAYENDSLELAADLSGNEQDVVQISLRQAVITAINNNLDVQFARLQPAIRETDVVEAEAAFDAVFFANLNHAIIDEPSTVPVLNGIPLGSAFSVRDNTTFETGIRKPLTTGGTLTASTRIDGTNNKTPGFGLSPDPAYTTRIIVGLEQPLLRGFGSEVNTAQIRLARNADRRTIQQLRTTLLQTIEATETSYWNLVVAQRTLLIQQRLLERGIATRDRLERRAIRDVSTSQLTDAVATVERRRANVIEARRRVRAASDQLKRLMNDPAMTVGSEVLAQPTDFMVESPLEYNLREAIVTAIEYRPEIHQAVLDLDNRAINLTVADNARLPLLNATARMEFIGLDNSIDEAYDESVETSFIDYFFGLVFEQPIGNRAAEANYREARLEQSAAAISYRNAVQQVVFDVKSALRDVVTNYELIEATRSTRLAQAENLRALIAEQENRVGLTPESLNLRFQRQEGLAQAEIQEIQALSNFNTAIARLYRAMGVGMQMNGIDIEPLAAE